MSKRSPGLDVIRAAAVIAVLIAHVEIVYACVSPTGTPSWMAAVGGVAVHMFYALSGYLIGHILIGVIDVPTPASWFRFMGRRWTRTLPLYGILIAVVALMVGPTVGELAGYLTMTQTPLRPVATDRMMVLLYPSWSLAVEEWFYLLFSVSLLSMVAIFGRRAIWPTIVTFLLVPLALRATSLGHADHAYYSVVLNLDGIAAGVALAQLQRQGSNLFRHPVKAFAAGCSLLFIAWAPYVLGGISPYVSWAPGSLTMSCAGCALIVAAALSLPASRLDAVFRAISVRSYSIYLTHAVVLCPLLTLVLGGRLSPTPAAALFFLETAVVSCVTYRWIEQPGMKLRLPAFRRLASKNYAATPASILSTLPA